METPPSLPPELRPPLGKTFAWTLLGPVGIMGVAAAFGGLSPRNSSLQGFGLILSLATLVAMLVCSVLCSVWIGRRKGGGIGFASFLGILVFYVAVAFAGCAAVLSGMSFR